MKERIKVDLELRYLDTDFDHLLEISTFLDPIFKLNYVNSRAKVLEQIETEMSRLIECPVDNVTSLPSASDTSKSDDPSVKVPPPKRQGIEQNSRSLSR